MNGIIVPYQRMWRLNAKRIFPLLLTSHSLVTKSALSNRIVYYSRSKNIYKNLAFEEWLFENTDLSNTDILLVWQSSPCVVIGRHQNPWMETNMPSLKKQSVHLARRSSGGGAVYHDEGNLNLSFMKDRARYNRRENLELVVQALASKWNLDLSINERDDIVLDGVHKVSGTAAKLSRNKSYHHFTLLHSVETSKLSGMLTSSLALRNDSPRKEQFVDSKSTQSVPSSVKNIQERAPSMTFDQMVDAVAAKFLENPLLASETCEVIDPLDEQQYPGVCEIFHRLQTWNWVYGKTPKFSIKMETSWKNQNSLDFVQDVCVTVEKGCLSSYVITLNGGSQIDLAYVNNLKGVEMKKENMRLLTDVNLLFGRNFCTAYNHQHLLDVRNLSDSIQDCLPELFDFL